MGKKTSFYNDIALRLAKKVLGCEYLHFGLYPPGLERTISNFPEAQETYFRELVGMIPQNQNIHRVLDVGCGVGGGALHLLGKGYQVTCVEPDSFMISETLRRTEHRVVTHQGTYQDFEDLPEGTFDLVLMSESSQYVPIERTWEQHNKHLRRDGFFLVGDFFKISPVQNPHISKSGHMLDEYVAKGKAAGFELVEQRDVSQEVAPTLDLYQEILLKYAYPVAEAAIELIQRRSPAFFWVLEKLFGRKAQALADKYRHQGSEDFLKNKRYYFLLFRKQASH